MWRERSLPYMPVPEELTLQEGAFSVMKFYLINMRETFHCPVYPKKSANVPRTIFD
jgi:hypothetical protein